MILPRYEKIYDEFIKMYEENHVCPWHELSKEQVESLYQGYILNNDVTNDYSFLYMVDYIIKRFSGLSDAHTSIRIAQAGFLPLRFLIQDEDVYVVGSDDENILFNRLLSINGINIDTLLEEIDDRSTYGTEGYKRDIMEKSLFRVDILLSLPSLNGSNGFQYKFINENGEEVRKDYPLTHKNIKPTYLRVVPTPRKNLEYEIKDDTVILYYNSCVNSECENMNKVVKELDQLLTTRYVSTFIVDIRNNYGGNSGNNTKILDLLDKHKKVKIITLTNNRTFSSGRFMLMGLQKLGTMVVGEQSGTPINCFGNIGATDSIENFNYFISTKYFYFGREYGLTQARSKEEYKMLPNFMKVTDYMEPDVVIIPTIDDFKAGVDPVMEYALSKEYMKTGKER